MVTKSLFERLVIDVIMAVLMVTGFAYQLLGNTAHEIFGIMLLIFFLFHNAINYRWYLNCLRWNGGPGRLISSVTNLLLLVAALTMVGTGLLNSHLFFASDPISPDQFIRRIHVLAANWFLLLASVHLGLHWRTLTGAVRPSGGYGILRRSYLAARQALTAVILIYGIYSSIQFDLLLKLTGYYSFGYWDFESYPFVFFVQYFSIIFMIAIIIHKILRTLQCLLDRHEAADRGGFPTCTCTVGEVDIFKGSE
jgi:hypothetical protein